MAIETKVMQIENRESVINKTNEIMSCFGWDLMNIQITHSQNTKTYSSAWDQIGGNQSQTVETTTINYATVTYQRDKAMEHYAEIVELEERYFDLETMIAACRKEADKKDAIGCLSLLYWPIAVYKLIKNHSLSNSGEIYAKINEYQHEQEEILSRARTLVS